MVITKLKLKEKIGYALGDTATNLAWRSLTVFLLVFYVDVLKIHPAAAGLILLVTRFSDGITDIIMGVIADRTNTKYGKFRPWILWSTIPFGILLALTFTDPKFGYTGKLIWAYVTYIALTLAYTANNVPYNALMGVMSPDHKERTSLSSFRFAGAYFGGILIQVGLLYLVAFFGKGNKNIGYQYSMYLFSALLIILLFITFFTTKERVKPQTIESTNVLKDFMDLFKNKPWFILLLTGFFFVIFNSIKQGITVMYFERYVDHATLAGIYMGVLLVVSMIAALITNPLAKIFGKKNLFIYTMIFAGIMNGIVYFANPENITFIFIFGSLSEFGAAIMPVLFFTMLGDSADYSEFKNNRRATGLVYSAGTFAMKFGGGVAGAVIGFVLAAYGYNSDIQSTITFAIPGIKLLMSWVPVIFIFIGALVMMFYPLTKKKMEEFEIELNRRRQ